MHLYCNQFTNLYLSVYHILLQSRLLEKIDFYREQPDVSFKHKMLLLLETKSPNQLIFWSTYEQLNQFINHEFLRTMPSIEHREEDHNRDEFFMECAAYVQYSTSLPGFSFSSFGDLLLIQRQPLRHSGKDDRYNIP
ncbi:transmembrane protein 231 [Caerostris extrusa]|uniref:Transmembrane protein 231 n=1 Tax=Caerostris extrusa TaxID=172846 RepID=A0AAV4M625_CAEEX|nr:transmembrane protein 231 [Caerostris extrusa]